MIRAIISFAKQGFVVYPFFFSKVRLQITDFLISPKRPVCVCLCVNSCFGENCYFARGLSKLHCWETFIDAGDFPSHFDTTNGGGVRRYWESIFCISTSKGSPHTPKSFAVFDPAALKMAKHLMSRVSFRFNNANSADKF